MTTRLRILFFSSLIDIVQTNELEREFDRELTVTDLLCRLYEEFPDLRAWDRQILVSADLGWVDRSAKLNDGQEIGIMPPVQGG